MPRRIPDLGQRPPAGERVADERMPAVVDGQHAEAVAAQRLAGRQEPAAEGVALEGTGHADAPGPSR